MEKKTKNLNEPPKKNRKEREQERKRNEILDAAERLFFSRGYEATSINEIAEEAEFSKGTLYLYFSGKPEIYLAIVNRSLEIIQKMLEKKEGQANSGAQKIILGSDTFVEFFKKYPDYFKLWIKASDLIDKETYFNHALGKECQTREINIMKQNVDSFAQGIEDGTIGGVDNPVYGALASMIFHRGLYSFLLNDKGRLFKALGVDQTSFIKYMHGFFKKGLEIKDN